MVPENELPLDASDPDWFEATGACGGCGEDTCHPGSICDGDPCRLCPARIAEGWFCAPDCTTDHR